MLTKAAVEQAFWSGFRHSNAEVLLLGFCQQGNYTDDMFSASKPVALEKVMWVLYEINGR